MKRWQNKTISPKGNLMIGEFDTVELINKYSTPLMIMDEKTIRQNCSKLKNKFNELGINGDICYASKAFCTKAIYKIVESEGLCVDTVSSGEIYTALSAGFDSQNIYFHGNNKTISDLNYAVSENIGRIIIDNFEEIANLQTVAKMLNKKQKVSLRLCPSVVAKTFSAVVTGAKGSKFGVSCENGDAQKALKQIDQCENLILEGLHVHIGSQIMNSDEYLKTVEVIVDFVNKLKKEGIAINEVNFGGGFGIDYIDEQNAEPAEMIVEEMYILFKELCKKNDLALPRFLIEPGRSIVADAGITLYTIGSVKYGGDIESVISIDGGMADNPRYALYQAEYTFDIANKASQEKTLTASIAGRCCESGDFIAKHIKIQPCKAGDILVAYSTGAFNYSMASNYNRLPKPEILLINGDKCSSIVKRETFEQLAQNESIPSWL